MEYFSINMINSSIPENTICNIYSPGILEKTDVSGSSEKCHWKEAQREKNNQIKLELKKWGTGFN